MYEELDDEVKHVIRGRHLTYSHGQKVTLITSLARVLRVYLGWV